MPGSNVWKYKRIAAGIMGILMLLIMLLSAFYIASEADHDCTGEDCPICACIQQCENTLRQIGYGAAFCIAVIFPAVFTLISSFLYAVGFPQKTPVSGKVRLNN